MPTKKKIIVRIGISVAVLIACVLAYTAYNFWSISARLNRKIAALREAGDPVCIADLARKPVEPERNAMTYLLQADEEMKAVVNAVYDLKSFQEDLYEPEDMQKIKEALDAHPKVFPLLEQAAACPDIDFHLDYSLTPFAFFDKQMEYSSVFRNATRYLRARLIDSLYRGNRDDALRSAIQILQLSRKLEQEPLVLSTSVVPLAIKCMALECAARILQAEPVSDRMQQDFEKELSLNDSRGNAIKALKCERAFNLDMSKKEAPLFFTTRWQLSALEVYEVFLEFPSLPYSTWADNEIIKNANIRGGNFLAVLDLPAKQLPPALQAALIPAYRCQAMVRSMRIINALQNKSPPSNAAVAPTMAELGLPEEVGIDPFNGKPMIIKKLPDGWLVYSVGENLKDDGGKVVAEADNRPLDVGFGPKNNIEEKTKRTTDP